MKIIMESINFSILKSKLEELNRLEMIKIFI
jgi:hypothetical protein